MRFDGHEKALRFTAPLKDNGSSSKVAASRFATASLHHAFESPASPVDSHSDADESPTSRNCPAKAKPGLDSPDDVGNAPTASLWVGNTPRYLTATELIHRFENYGKIKSVKISPSGLYAFVNYCKVESAVHARVDLHNETIFHKTEPSWIRYAKPPPFDGASKRDDNNENLCAPPPVNRLETLSGSMTKKQDTENYWPNHRPPTGPKIRVDISPPPLRRRSNWAYDTYSPAVRLDSDQTSSKPSYDERVEWLREGDSYRPAYRDEPRKTIRNHLSPSANHHENGSQEARRARRNSHTRVPKDQNDDENIITSSTTSAADAGIGRHTMSRANDSEPRLAQQQAPVQSADLEIGRGVLACSQNTTAQPDEQGRLDQVTENDVPKQTQADAAELARLTHVEPLSEPDTREGNVAEFPTKHTAVENEKSGFPLLSALLDNRAASLQPLSRNRSPANLRTSNTPLSDLTTSSRASSVKKRCSDCRKPEAPSVPLIRCTNCPKRFHTICGDPRPLDVNNKEKFICGRCITKARQTAESVARPAEDQDGQSYSNYGSVHSACPNDVKAPSPVSKVSAALLPAAVKTATMETGSVAPPEPDISRVLDTFSLNPMARGQMQAIRDRNRDSNDKPESKQEKETPASVDLRKEPKFPGLSSAESRKHISKSQIKGYMVANPRTIAGAKAMAEKYKTKVTCPAWQRNRGGCSRTEEECMFAHHNAAIETPNGWNVAKEWTCYRWKLGRDGCPDHEIDCLYSHKDTGLYVGFDGKPMTKHRTCYWWYHNGRCRKPDELCVYAHFWTGIVAESPGAKVPRQSVGDFNHDSGNQRSIGLEENAVSYPFAYPVPQRAHDTGSISAESDRPVMPEQNLVQREVRKPSDPKLGSLNPSTDDPRLGSRSQKSVVSRPSTSDGASDTRSTETRMEATPEGSPVVNTATNQASENVRRMSTNKCNQCGKVVFRTNTCVSCRGGRPSDVSEAATPVGIEQVPSTTTSGAGKRKRPEDKMFLPAKRLKPDLSITTRPIAEAVVKETLQLEASSPALRPALLTPPIEPQHPVAISHDTGIGGSNAIRQAAPALRTNSELQTVSSTSGIEAGFCRQMKEHGESLLHRLPAPDCFSEAESDEPLANVRQRRLVSRLTEQSNDKLWSDTTTDSQQQTYSPNQTDHEREDTPNDEERLDSFKASNWRDRAGTATTSTATQGRTTAKLDDVRPAAKRYSSLQHPGTRTLEHSDERCVHTDNDARQNTATHKNTLPTPSSTTGSDMLDHQGGFQALSEHSASTVVYDFAVPEAYVAIAPKELDFLDHNIRHTVTIRNDSRRFPLAFQVISPTQMIRFSPSSGLVRTKCSLDVHVHLAENDDRSPASDTMFVDITYAYIKDETLPQAIALEPVFTAKTQLTLTFWGTLHAKGSAAQNLISKHVSKQSRNSGVDRKTLTETQDLKTPETCSRASSTINEAGNDSGSLRDDVLTPRASLRLDDRPSSNAHSSQEKRPTSNRPKLFLKFNTNRSRPADTPVSEAIKAAIIDKEKRNTALSAKSQDQREAQIAKLRARGIQVEDSDGEDDDEPIPELGDQPSQFNSPATKPSSRRTNDSILLSKISKGDGLKARNRHRLILDRQMSRNLQLHCNPHAEVERGTKLAEVSAWRELKVPDPDQERDKFAPDSIVVRKEKMTFKEMLGLEKDLQVEPCTVGNGLHTQLAFREKQSRDDMGLSRKRRARGAEIWSVSDR